MSYKLIAAALAGVAALAAATTASAFQYETDTPPPVKPDATGGVKFSGGILNANGTVAYGSGFTSVRNAAGDYTITYPAGAFPTGVAVMTCSPFGISSGGVPVCLIYGEAFSHTGVSTFRIRVYSLAGALKDNQVQFTEITTK